MLKKISPLIFGAIIGWFVYMTAATGMYTYRLAEFYEVDYNFKEHGIALNGRTAFGDMISVSDLAVTSVEGGGPVNEWCPDIKSERGNLTMGFVGDDTAVCCWVADNNQWLVPYKDVGDTRHYLCGEWPFLDHVTQPINASKLKIN